MKTHAKSSLFKNMTKADQLEAQKKIEEAKRQRVSHNRVREEKEAIRESEQLSGADFVIRINAREE